ncbi:hypothetical protein CYMTET_6559 [Cymbomonas tetramitiformis]|uniref:Uncharacterized protein n=1 Tax=Cymbomonas tetramitiformis TaxID=36881 RepID=A0AAE0GXA7_9CHLO|nr:hypothetical protein CYMTET_6559 [Cymbomonas tetramitiformis]
MHGGIGDLSPELQALVLARFFSAAASTSGASLFNLDDVTLVVRKEANELLFSTLELLAKPHTPAAAWIDAPAHVYPRDGKRALLEILREVSAAGAAFDSTQDFLDIRFEAGVDPRKKNVDFNAAYALASQRNTFRTPSS